ncbi:MAG: hypothetical protein AB1567_06840 [bacterium]
MEFWLLASKCLAVLGGLSVLFSTQPQVALMPPQMSIEADYLTVKTKLLNAFPQELDEIFLSGTPVILKFKVSLREKNTHLLKEEEVVFHKVSYDLIKKEYSIVFSSYSTSPPKKTSDILEMKKWFGELNTKLISYEKILPEKLYLVEVEAYLLPIEIRALKRKKFDLMSFWKYKVPKVTLEAVLKE